MYTKEKIKFPLLKDKVAKKLFTEKKVGLEYLRKIISLAIGIPMDMIDKDIKLIHPSIGINKNIVNSEADVVLENDEFYVNLEINYYKNETSDIKNLIATNSTKYVKKRIYKISSFVNSLFFIRF